MSNTSNSSLKYKKQIGPSQFAAALGYDDYLSPLELKKQIEKGYISKNNHFTIFGQENESIALYYYQKIYKRSILNPYFVRDIRNKRIFGIADSLFADKSGGIEIKCHVGAEPLKRLPMKYLLQMVGYMYLYKKKSWLLMSCVFNTDHHITKYSIFEVKWSDVKDQWQKEWYPNITKFIDHVKWQEDI